MGQFTLKSVRESCGYAMEESAKLCGISVEELREFENDTSIIPVSVLCKMKALYKIPLALIFIGQHPH